MTDRDGLREAKADLLAGGLVSFRPDASTVPQPIERSWRRSVSLGVSPTMTGSADVVDDIADDELLTAARPVITALAADLADQRVAVVLCDAGGRIIDRVVRSASQRRRLDAAGAVIGSDFSEQAIGTNGLGSVIEDRAPLFVQGAEHFSEALEEITCAGVPILDPRTRRVRGSLSLTSMASDSNPLMLTLTHAAVRDIETRLLGGRDQGLHDLASAFAIASRGQHGAIALLTPRTVLANTAGLPYVSPANHAAIWDSLVSANIEQPQLLRLDLVGGAVNLRAQRVLVADEDLAFQVAISPVRANRASRDGARPRWHPVSAVDTELRSIAAVSAVVAIVGGAGSGKTYTARMLLGADEAGFEDLDPAGARSPWPRSWLGSVRFALASGRRVLLRNVHSMPSSDLAALGVIVQSVSEIDEQAPAPARLVLTIDPAAASPELLSTVSRGASLVELPTLDAMRSSIPLIVEALLSRQPARERCTISPAAMQALMRREWPGNISELRHVVNHLMATRPGAVIRESDLPSAGHRSRAWSGIERSERAAITDALREAGGNRAEAARILGIGRTTLYRKLRSLRIDQDDVSG